jgi:hypothetical protein
MERVELFIEKKKAAKLISFLKELDFVKVKEIKGEKNPTKKDISDIIIPATNPQTDISGLFGAWKNTKINSSVIRTSSRKIENLKW